MRPEQDDPLRFESRSDGIAVALNVRHRNHGAIKRQSLGAGNAIPSAPVYHDGREGNDAFADWLLLAKGNVMNNMDDAFSTTTRAADAP
jgi:hypothetical protein